MELYRFSGTFTINQYHSGDIGDVNCALGVFLGKPIQRSSLETGILADELELTVPDDLAPMPEFLPRSPYGFIEVTVYSYPDLRTLFSGVISTVEFNPKEHTAKVKVANKLVLEKGSAPFRTFSQTCSWELFGAECGVLSATHTAVEDINNVVFNDFNIQVPIATAQPDGYYNGGFLELETGQRQYIVSHTGNNLGLLIPIDQDNMGATLTLYAGCDKSEATCIAKFDNINNFSGFPKIPVINPVTDGF